MMTTLTRSTSSPVPQTIVRTLGRLVRRSRLVTAVRGLCAVTAIAICSLLVIMGIDAFVTIFAAWPRWVLTSSAAVMTFLAAAWFLVRPLARAFSLAGIARAIEARHPELHERISSAIELMSSADADELRGSRAMIEALAAEACRDIVAVTPKREVTLRSIRPFFIAALAGAAILGGFYMLWPARTSLLLARAIAPNRELANIHADSLTITPGDVTVAQGQSLRIEVQVSDSRVPTVQFCRAASNGDKVEDMVALGAPGGGLFAITIPQVTESFRYRIRGGDARSRYYDVSVVPLPAVGSMDIAYEYPAYTGKAPQVVRNAQGDIVAPAGTKLTVTVHANAGVTSAAMLVTGQPEVAGQVDAMGDVTTCTFHMDMPLRLQGLWSIRLGRRIGAQEVANSSPEHRIESQPDAAPTVKVVAPASRKLRLRPSEHLPIQYVASDDLGISRLEIRAKVDGRDRPVIEIPLPASEGPCRVAAGTVELDLARLDLKAASGASFQLRALDTLPPDAKGPQEGLSETFEIDLDLYAKPFPVQVTLSDELLIRQMLQELLKELQVAKQDSAAMERVYLNYSLALKEAAGKGDAAQDVKAPNFSDDTIKQIDRMREHLTNADKLDNQVLEKVSGSAFATMAQKVQTAGAHIRDADSNASQLKLVDEAIQRVDKTKQADFHVHRAILIVTELLEQLHVMSDLAVRAEELGDLSQRQDELADAKAAMQAAADSAKANPASGPAAAGAEAITPPMSPQDWKRMEAQLAGQLGAVAGKSPAVAAIQAKRDQEQAKDLLAEARKQVKEQANLAKDSQRLAKQQELAREQKKLAAEQNQLAQEARQNTDTAEQGKPMAAAGDDIRSGKLDDALKKQDDAKAALEAKSNPVAPATQPSEQNVKAGDLASRQADIRKRTADLSDQKRALEHEQPNELAALQERQDKIAKEAGDLSDQARKLAPQADELDTKAAMDARKAADDLGQNKPKEAAESAAGAADKLDKLSDRLAKDAGKTIDEQADAQKHPAPESGDKPSLAAKGATDQEPQQVANDQAQRDKGKLADHAKELSHRQKSLAEQMKALAANDYARLAAARQNDLTDRTAQLEQDTKLIQTHADEVLPDAQTRKEASNAANELSNATASQAQAKRALDNKNAASSAAHQQASAGSLQKAAEALERLGNKLAESAAKGPKPGEEDREMADAYDAARDAVQTEQLKDAALAAKLLDQLSRQAAAAAAAQGIDPSAMKGLSPQAQAMKPGQSADPKGSMKMMAVSLTQADLQKMGISTEDWGRLSGKLRDEVLQAAQENCPEEYRSLVKQYFQEVARRGSAGDVGGKK